MSGRLGVLRQVAGEVAGAWLFEGHKLMAGVFSIETDRPAYSGQVQAETRKADGDDADAFITDADLPRGDGLHGVWMVVTHGNGYKHGYEIDRVEKRDGKTLVILTMDHGLRIEGNETEQVYYPCKKIAGENTFTIPLAAAMCRG